MRRPFLFLLGCLLVVLPRLGRAQVVTAGRDSTVVSTGDSTTRLLKPKGLSRPAKAALWALIPGGGQVYNHDYWKVPFVYAALGGVTYLVVHYNGRYQEFRRGYEARTDGDTLTLDTGEHSSLYIRDETVLRARNFYRRNRDLNIVFSGVVYGLSIMEALVDAHLATFSISDDLSLRAEPTLVPLAGVGVTPGVGLTLTVR